MARLKLSPSGLRGPLDAVVPEEPTRLAAVTPIAPVPVGVVTGATAPAPSADRENAAHAVAKAPATVTTPSPIADPTPDATPTVSDRRADRVAPAMDRVTETTPPEGDSAIVTEDHPTPIASHPVVDPTADTIDEARATADGLPAWTVGLDVDRLRPDRLLGRPKQTALILDRHLSERADALVAATGPRVTFAGLVTAVLQFNLPADGAAAARTIGGYRRRRLDALDHPWEERNARVPEGLRTALDDVVAGATGRVASVRRSTLVNALLDTHLPDDPDEAARLVTRMEMVRGGAFLDVV
ncbi:MAG: hypothetical protein AB7G37_09360 [Solirubrobacteraceae bacterium]